MDKNKEIINLLRYLRGGLLGMLLEYMYRVEYNLICLIFCILLTLNIILDLDRKNIIGKFFLDLFIYVTLFYIWCRKSIGYPLKQDLSNFKQSK